MEIKYDLEVSKDNYEIVRVEINNQNKYIGSKYNQQKEIEKFINDIDTLKSNDIYIIFGLSCGEHLKKLLELKKSKNKILVIEHNDKLIDYVMGKYKFINKKNFIITNEEFVIRSFIRSIKSNLIDYVKIIHYSNYSKIFIEEVRKTFNVIKEEVTSTIINRNTELLFGEQWFETLLKNLKYGSEATTIGNFKNKFKNIPAVIVSAGPSLEKNIDLLKDNKNALIFTGGRTLRALLEKNIKPHLLGVVDSGEVSYELVEKNIDKINIPLLFNETTNSNIVKEHNFEKIVFGRSELFKKVWDNELEDFVVGGSIAHSLTQAAIYMGCNPIIFIGQDLAYTNELGHAKIAYNELDESIKELNDKSIFEEKYKRKNDIYVKSNDGNLVRTSLTLNEFRKSFENIIKINENIKFINATEGGALINGTEIKKLEDALIEISNGHNFENIIENLLNKKNKAKEINELIGFIKNELKNCINICGLGIKEVEDLKKNYQLNLDISENLKALNYVDSKIRKLIKDVDIINMLTYKTIYKFEKDETLILTNKDNKKETFNKIYNKSKKLYELIQENLKEAFNFIERNWNEI